MEYLLAKTQELKRQRLVYEVRIYFLYLVSLSFSLSLLPPSSSCIGLAPAHHVPVDLPPLFPHTHTHTHTQLMQQQQHDKHDEAEAAVEDEKEKEAQRFIEKQTAAASAGAVAGQGREGGREEERKGLKEVSRSTRSKICKEMREEKRGNQDTLNKSKNKTINTRERSNQKAAKCIA